MVFRADIGNCPGENRHFNRIFGNPNEGMFIQDTESSFPCILLNADTYKNCIIALNKHDRYGREY